MVSTLILAGVGLWLALSVVGLALVGYWHRSTAADDGEWRYPVESTDE